MRKPELSLRERQRREAWSAIHDAAANLVLEHGWASTTVDMIASVAGVSNRTFFNYFPSKEDAVLGLRTLTVPEHALKTFHNHDHDLFHRTVKLMTAVLRTAAPKDTFQQRTALIRDIPEIRTRLIRFASSTEELLEPILVEELSTNPANNDTQQDPHDTAKALLMVAGATIRFALTKDPAWASVKSDASLCAAITTFREAFRLSL